MAQGETNNWYFGDRAALNFGTGAPQPVFNSVMNAPEGCASVSDKTGSLLFYTNGVVVYNSNHQLMENGTGLKGNTSSTQSAVIVQNPEKNYLYYIFTVDNQAGVNGLMYSVVSMAENNGLGKVIVKNTPLASSTTEKITAVHSCNNKDVWVVTRMWNSDKFYSFLVDKNGVEEEPVISNSAFQILGDRASTLGSMKISPNGRMIAAAHAWGLHFVELAEFDRNTGKASRPLRFDVSSTTSPGGETGPYGIEFSPNSRLLYVYAALGAGKSYIYQYDLSSYNATDIQNSKKLIASFDFSFAGSLQLGPDLKIYATNSIDSSLSAISQPDLLGPACQFQFSVVKMGRPVSLGLPNFIQSFYDPDFSAGEFEANSCESRSLQFKIRRLGDIINVKWNFGDPASGAANTSTIVNPIHTYPTDGFYDVTLIAEHPCKTDTIKKRVYSGKLVLSMKPAVDGCEKNAVVLSAPFYSEVSYQWSTGEKTQTISVNKAGIYKVSILAGCEFSDSTQVNLYPKPVFSLGPDQQICTNQQIILDAGITNSRYIWNDGSQSRSITVGNTGIYWVKVSAADNDCAVSDTIKIFDRPFPAVRLGGDTTICETEKLVLKPVSAAQDLQFRWHDGSTGSSFTVSKPGNYHVRVSNDCIIKFDTISVSYKTCPLGIPNAFTPNGDGRNDVFRAKYGENVGGFRIEVFNRFGQMVFRSEDQLKGWDGRLNGKDQPVGTYIWVIRIKDSVTGKQISMRGTVNLLR